MMLHCNRCKEYLPDSSFGSDKSRVSGKSIYCKKCRARLAKDSRIRKPHIGRNHSRLKRYGISPEQYQKMLDKQNGVCAICESDTPGGGHNYLYIDHSHFDGTIRGLLCRDCNLLLGYAKDNKAILKSGIDYLKNFDSTNG